MDRFRGHTKISRLKQYRHLKRLFNEPCERSAASPGETTAPLEVSPTSPPTGSSSSSEAVDPAAAEGVSPPVVSPANEKTVSSPDKDVTSSLPEEADVSLKNPEQVASTSLQSPSDPDATYGHKGKGYQLQLVETCVPDNAFQVITATQLQGAHESDQKATLPLLKTLQDQDRQPQVAFADSNYIRGENIVAAQAMGVDLHGPLPGSAPTSDPLTLYDFHFDLSDAQVQACPQGHPPTRQVPARKGPGRRVYFARAVCAACPHAARCPTHLNQTERCLRWTPAQLATARRRHQQDTPALKRPTKSAPGSKPPSPRTKTPTAWPDCG